MMPDDSTTRKRQRSVLNSPIMRDFSPIKPRRLQQIKTPHQKNQPNRSVVRTVTIPSQDQFNLPTLPRSLWCFAFDALDQLNFLRHLTIAQANRQSFAFDCEITQDDVLDIDASGNDPTWVPQYSSYYFDCYMKEVELNQQSLRKPYALSLINNTNHIISEKKRAELIDFLFDICRRIRSSFATSLLAVHLFDQFLVMISAGEENTLMSWNQDEGESVNYIYICAATLMIACKYEECQLFNIDYFIGHVIIAVRDSEYFPAIEGINKSSFIALARNSPDCTPWLTPQKLSACELHILRAIDFQITPAPFVAFISRYVKAGECGSIDTALVRCICERLLYNAHMLLFLPSVVVASAVYMARMSAIDQSYLAPSAKMRIEDIIGKVQDSAGVLDINKAISEIVDASTWTPSLRHYTGYTSSQLQNCIDDIQYLFKFETYARARHYASQLLASSSKHMGTSKNGCYQQLLLKLRHLMEDDENCRSQSSSISHDNSQQHTGFTKVTSATESKRTAGIRLYESFIPLILEHMGSTVVETCSKNNSALTDIPKQVASFYSAEDASMQRSSGLKCSPTIHISPVDSLDSFDSASSDTQQLVGVQRKAYIIDKSTSPDLSDNKALVAVIDSSLSIDNRNFEPHVSHTIFDSVRRRYVNVYSRIITCAPL